MLTDESGNRVNMALFNKSKIRKSAESAIPLQTSPQLPPLQQFGAELYQDVVNFNINNTSEEKVVALIEVKVTPQRGMGFDKIAERIYQYNEVNAVYLMSGSFDFTVFIEGKTMRQVAQFVSDKLAPMESVLSTATHFVLKKYKDHGTIISEPVQDERMLITP